MSPDVVVQLVLLAAINVFSVTSIISYFSRRKQFPIAQRIPLLVVWESCLMLVLTNMFMLGATFPTIVFYNCGILMHTLPFEMASINIMIFRIGHLLAKDFYTKIMISNQRHFTSVGEKTDLQVRKSTYSNFTCVEQIWCKLLNSFGIPRTVFLICLPTYVFQVYHLIFISSVLSSVSDILFDNPKCFYLMAAQNATNEAALYAYRGVLGVLVGLGILRMNDNFKIGREFRLLLLACGFAACLFLPMLSASIYVGYTKVWFIGIGFVILPLIICLQTTLPVYYSFQKPERSGDLKKQQHSSGKPPEKDRPAVQSPQMRMQELLHVIGNKELRDLFLQFLESEFSVENLLFIEACSTLEYGLNSNKSLEFAKQGALEIYDKFIHVNSPSCINIPHQCRADLDVKFADLDHHCDVELFQDAKESVLKMLAFDSFSRFKSTKNYLQQHITINTI
eukprot:TRINITY_DN7222_c0_g2_i1.p1 TRINITY_DN7222_c0_g2~~TRINITY_DN7222_c0_g2_i1.p1  ORF type:complete len:451 (-),score=80.16 TRINITY_DN7222_c0_g2_i1:17-1369(-)